MYFNSFFAAVIINTLRVFYCYFYFKFNLVNSFIRVVVFLWGCVQETGTVVKYFIFLFRKSLSKIQLSHHEEDKLVTKHLNILKSGQPFWFCNYFPISQFLGDD